MKLTRWLIKSCILGCLFVFAAAGNSVAQVAESQTGKNREVLLTITVTNDRGVPIKGLNPEHFSISDRKKPVTISKFSDREEPSSILFLIDTSGSMAGGSTNGNILRFFVQGILNFLQEGLDANEYAILSFSNEVHLAQNWTKDKHSVEQALTGIASQPANGKTAFYDSCRQALDLTGRAQNRKKVVILLSDGQDTVSKDTRLGKLKEQIRAEDIIFYSITNVPMNGGLSLYEQSEDVLQELTSQTGGMSLFPKGQFEMDASFEVVGRLLRNQYVIGIKVAEPPDGKWHPVKVEIKLPQNTPRELKYPVARYQTGYFDRAELE
ncbi:MAG: VWA domain-containing protein [Acidobacteria bacterium]|nr:VWA domain-containing protein [Acidobacteriota bacterium]